MQKVFQTHDGNQASGVPRVEWEAQNRQQTVGISQKVMFYVTINIL